MWQKLTQSGLVWLMISVPIVFLDQWTKLWANSELIGGRVIEVTSWFNLILAYNYGAAFSFLADAGGWQKWALSVFAIGVTLVLLVWMYRLKASEKWLSIALAFVVSGAVGNVIDRVNYGYVIDFIDWHYACYHWPAFNIADSSILAGAAMLIIDSLFFAEKRESENKNSEHSRS